MLRAWSIVSGVCDEYPRPGARFRADSMSTKRASDITRARFLEGFLSELTSAGASGPGFESLSNRPARLARQSASLPNQAHDGTRDRDDEIDLAQSSHGGRLRPRPRYRHRTYRAAEQAHRPRGRQRPATRTRGVRSGHRQAPAAGRRAEPCRSFARRRQLGVRTGDSRRAGWRDPDERGPALAGACVHPHGTRPDPD